MQHKWMVVFSALVLLSSLLAPAGNVQAQGAIPDCPPYEPGMPRDSDFLHSLPPECMETYKELTRQASPAADARDGQRMATGGPDEFGYTYDDAVPYNWISATTNSGLHGDDESTGPINIGFNFPFYGVPQSQLYFSTNGLITFGSGSSEWAGYDLGIGTELHPNNVIAPFWDDLLVGSPANSGGIYYAQGGSAPNRYFVIEWRNAENWDESASVSFEAILYENGDIVFQYQNGRTFFVPVVGIEDSFGYDGLTYDSSNITPLKAVEFSYPAPEARVLVSPLDAGAFAPLSGHKDVSITVINSGGMGTDTYDLTVSSTWAVTLYASDGVTPLSDTDADTVIDTGPIPQGASKTLIARFSIPPGAQTGDSNTANIIVRSSVDAPVYRRTYPSLSIPASFVNVFKDEANGAMSFMTVTPNATNTYKATADNYFASGTSVTKLVNGNYFYVWNNRGSTQSNYWRDIEYSVLGSNGSVIRPTTKLTDNAGATFSTDWSPSVAVTPNGTVGVAWYRRLENSSSQHNYNIYFATLDSSGNLLTGPTNITNNTVWGTRNDFDFPTFLNPTIAASDDNRFVIAWEDDRQGMMGGDVYDIWYVVRNATGTSILAPTNFTNNMASQHPILNSLTGGKVIMTWTTFINGPYYAVIGSNGAVVKPETFLPTLADNEFHTPDAVQLPNGNVGLAWASDDLDTYFDPGIELAILDSSYNRIAAPAFAYNPVHPSPIPNEDLSVTTDASSHVIITWNGRPNQLFYALGDSNGTFLTDPMIYKTSGSYIYSSGNGQGNAPYQPAATSSFTDVQTTHWAYSYIERLYASGITAGCGGGQYCPESTVTRAQMAVFLLRGIHGSSYTPPAVGASTGFGDVPTGHWAAAWIKQLAAEGITSGCGGGDYCPEASVTRAQMAVFLLRAKHGLSYSPPAVGGSTGFGDVATDHWAGAWIKQLVVEGITAGCGNNNYCPDSSVTRAEMAVFLVRAFNLP